MHDKNIHIRGNALAHKTGATHYNTQFGLPDKSRAIKELVVCRRIGHKILHIMARRYLYQITPSDVSRPCRLLVVEFMNKIHGWG